MRRTVEVTLNGLTAVTKRTKDTKGFVFFVSGRRLVPEAVVDDVHSAHGRRPGSCSTFTYLTVSGA